MTGLLFTLFKVAVAFFGLGVLIFVHELGHFIAAKHSGVGVTTFSIGFGKKLWGFKRGETEYKVCIIPLGGYVKLMGLEDKCNDPKKSFANKPKLARLRILAAGVVFNFLFAIILFTFVNMHSSERLRTTVRPGKDMPAAEVLVEGDEIIEVNGVEVFSWEEISAEIGKTDGEPVNLTIIRGKRLLEVKVRPVKQVVEDQFGAKVERWMIGIGPNGETVTVPGMGPAGAFVKSVKTSGEVYVLTYSAIGKLFTKKAKAEKTLGGPVLIMTYMTMSVSYGFLSFLHFLAFISLALAIFNSMPIPVLDGGHMMFIGIEAIRGKPLSKGMMEKIQTFFFVLLLVLMVFILYLDIMRVLPLK